MVPNARLCVRTTAQPAPARPAEDSREEKQGGQYGDDDDDDDAPDSQHRRSQPYEPLGISYCRLQCLPIAVKGGRGVATSTQAIDLD